MKKIKTLFCLMVIMTLVIIFNISNNVFAYTTITSDTLLEQSTIDDLVLNYRDLPQVSIEGISPGNYEIMDRQGAVSTDITVRAVYFKNAPKGTTVNGKVTAKFNNCGTLNGRPIDMKLEYSDFVIGNHTNSEPLIYWSAFGDTQERIDEWWYSSIEHMSLKIYFYYSGESTPINLGTAYLSIYSEDVGEGISALSSTNQYIYQNTYMQYNENYTSLVGAGRTYKNVFYGGEGQQGTTDAGTLRCVGFQFKNVDHIEVELYDFNPSYYVGYHIQYTPLTAAIPPNPTKSVNKNQAKAGDELTYTVRQKMSDKFDSNFHYSELKFIDSLDSNLTYTDNSLKVYDEAGNDVTASAGSSSFDRGSNTLTYTFNNNYLENSMQYGKYYRFEFKAKIKENIRRDYVLNDSTIEINNRYTLDSNEVRTDVERKRSNVTAKYVDQITGTEISGREEKSGYVGDHYDTTKKSIPGYTFVEVQGDASGEYDVNSKTVTYYYVKSVDLTVQHVDKDTGKPLVPDETRNLKQGDSYTTQSKDLEGYKLVETPDNANGTMGDTDKTVTYTYELIKVNIDITKTLEATDSTEIQNLAGAVFTAESTYFSDLVKIAEPKTTYVSTTTDSNGHCIIEGLPYGRYTITETTVPDVAYNGKFKLEGNGQVLDNLEITIDQDKTYTYNLEDVAKKMQIKINKEDAETGNVPQGDAHLEGAEYTVYRDALCTDPVETLTIQKQEDGTYSAESGWYLVGTYYVKETKAPVGYLIDETVYTVEQNLAEQVAERSNHEITSKEQVIRNDIEIVKNLEETDSSRKQNLAGAVFTATLNSDKTKTYESTPTDADGNCIIENLPYGTYTVEETTVPDVAYNGEFYVNGATDRKTTFEQFIEVDQGTNEPYVWGDITDVAKKMKIKINKEDAETGNITQGDAVLENAEYTIYRNQECTDAVETLTIQKQEDGTYSAESGWYLVGTYYVKETKAPVGYLIDETVYTVEQNPAEQSEEFSNHEITSKEQVIRNDIEIVKNLEKTDSTEKQSLAGAVFTATLNSDETKTYESTPTDVDGNCIIKDLPYGTYTVEETTVPDAAYNGEFYINGATDRSTTFEQFIEVDQGANEPYVWGDITDVAKKMQITIYKQDSETITQTQGDAHLEGAEYTIYRDEACTDPVETLTIQKNEYGVYSAESGEYICGTYYIKETKAPEGYNIDEKVYKVEQKPSEQKEEYSTHQITSHEDVIRNDIEIIKSLEATDSSEKQSLEGAVFTATLLSDETQTWESTPTDEEGYCVIEDLPYGTYKVEETTIPDIAYNGEFYANEEIERAKEFEQYVELDKGSNEPYVWEIEDVAKKMQIEIYKEDSETGSQAQEDAFLEGAEYTVYRDEECTDAIETLTIEKNEDGTYSAKSGEYLVGTYYVKETKAPEGYDMDETLYVVEQDAKEQKEEYSYHNLTSQDRYIPIPETGDILVYTLSGVLMVSVFGIVYVVRKNRKENNI